MRGRFIVSFLIVFLISVTYVYAEQGDVQNEHMGAMSGHMKSETSSAVEVGNKICPVSGEKIGEMGPAEQYEYNGKVYNFCCAGCVEEFKKDPEKYVKIMEGQMKGDMKKHMGQQMEMKEGGDQEEHHQMMNEKGEHMMMKMNDDTSMIEGQMKGDMEKHMGQQMEMREEGEQEEHHQMMNEKGEHMMMKNGR